MYIVNVQASFFIVRQTSVVVALLTYISIWMTIMQQSVVG